MKKIIIGACILCLGLVFSCADNQTDDHKDNDNPAEGLDQVEMTTDNTSTENSETNNNESGGKHPVDTTIVK